VKQLFIAVKRQTVTHSSRSRHVAQASANAAKQTVTHGQGSVAITSRNAEHGAEGERLNAAKQSAHEQTKSSLEANDEQQ
jgi:hypothetical protein